MDRAALVLMALICTVVIVAALLGAVWIVDRLTTKVELEVRPPTSSHTAAALSQLSWSSAASSLRSATATDVTASWPSSKPW